MTAEDAVAAAEKALSDANENGSVTAIQRAETRLSNAMERFNRCGISPSVRADRIRDYDRRPMQPIDILGVATTACSELAEGIAKDDIDLIVAAERRLVALGPLAQTNANTLELGRRP